MVHFCGIHSKHTKTCEMRRGEAHRSHEPNYYIRTTPALRTRNNYSLINAQSPYNASVFRFFFLILINLKIRVRERALLSTVSLPRCHTGQDWGLARLKLEASFRSLNWRQGPKLLDRLPLPFPVTLSRELDWNWSNWDFNWCPYGMPELIIYMWYRQ